MRLLLPRAASFLELAQTVSGKCSDLLRRRVLFRVFSADRTGQSLGHTYLSWEMVSPLFRFSVLAIVTRRIRRRSHGVPTTMSRK